MTYAWARWLADALRSDPVVEPRVIEVDGWRDRGRPPDRFSYLPSGVLGHHTACMANIGHEPSGCLRVIRDGHGGTPGPIAQLLLSLTPTGVRWTGNNLDPRVYVVAAGRSNHAGGGVYPWGAPAGNGSSIGLEVCGPPDYWPDELVDIRARVEAALLRWNNWGVDQYTTHYWYTRQPDGRARKVDQSGPYKHQRTLSRTQPWDLTTWRNEIAPYLAPLEPPPEPSPPLTENAMYYAVLPARIFDSRATGKIGASGTVVVPRASALPASGATTAVVNVTMVDATDPGWLTVWGGGPQPQTSDVNATRRGDTIANEIHVPLAADGSFRIFSSAGAHVLCDLKGYFRA